MQIPASEVKKKKIVGKHDGDDIFEVQTVGGLNLILASRKKGAETLGVGSHRAVARYLAQKKARGLQWTELSKSDDVPVEAFSHLLPKYEALTDAVRKKQGFE